MNQDLLNAIKRKVESLDETPEGLDYNPGRVWLSLEAKLNEMAPKPSYFYRYLAMAIGLGMVMVMLFSGSNWATGNDNNLAQHDHKIITPNTPGNKKPSDSKLAAIAPAKKTVKHGKKRMGNLISPADLVIIEPLTHKKKYTTPAINQTVPQIVSPPVLKKDAPGTQAIPANYIQENSIKKKAGGPIILRAPVHFDKKNRDTW